MPIPTPTFRRRDMVDAKLWHHRTCPPEATCRWLNGLRDKVGITRVGDLTGLDRLGIPVFQAVRPLGLSLSVSQGKGLSVAAARVSALMESVEIWHAEHEALPRFRASGKALEGKDRLDPNGLLRRGATPISHYVPIAWSQATDLGGGAKTLVPSDAVNLDFTRRADPPDLARSTTGLAGGNTQDEARASALAEVIERRCQRDFLDQDPITQAACRLDPDLLARDDPNVAAMVARINDAGLHLDLFDMTNQFEVTAIRAVLYETERGEPVARPSLGHGAHLDPITAVTRAITEAAQARLTGISGNRDDINPGIYRGADLTNWVRAATKGMDLAGARRALHRHDDSTASPAKDADRMLARVLSRGAGPVAEVDLSRPDMGVPVVKILAPNVAYLASR